MLIGKSNHNIKKFICIHGHFYQPPRENPWLEEIERQDSAYPYHDWNQRITAECYAPNYAARILSSKEKIINIVNNYTKMSFNFGPTLLSWLERNEKDIHEAIITSDKETIKKFSGHGSAMSQCYNHMIMPLANEQDKKTQVYWGIIDFIFRYGRKPEGMWLPETAVDAATLTVLADQGIKFTILAPNQAKSIKHIKTNESFDVSCSNIDTRRAYRLNLPNGKNICIFFYNGHISQNVAFGDLLRHADNFANALLGSFSNNDLPEIVNISTDGETFGHHHNMGDMGLACCFDFLEKNPNIQITNYGEFLENFPIEYEVEIFDNSSWSCVHGIERWRSDCGCNTGLNNGWNQKWRKPLREGFDYLQAILINIYETEGASLLKNVWDARNDYIEVILNRSKKNVSKFLSKNAKKHLSNEQKIKTLKLLEMQRHAMLMYTSCGWFFDEVSGIETIQNFYYASRAIQLAQELTNKNLEIDFIDSLKRIPSNIDIYENGANIYNVLIRPNVLNFNRVGAHYAVSSLFEDYSEKSKIYCFSADNKMCLRQENDENKLALGKVMIRSEITSDCATLCYAVINLQDHNILCGVKELKDEKSFIKFVKELKNIFRKGEIEKTKIIIEKFFQDNNFSLKHLFKDEQSKILYEILDNNLIEIEQSLRKINEYHSPIIKIVKELHIPLPKILSNTIAVMLNADILRVVSMDQIDFSRLKEMISEIHEWNLEVDRLSLSFSITRRLDGMMIDLLTNSRNTDLICSVANLLEVLKPLSLSFDFWKSQNAYFSIAKNEYESIKVKAKQGDYRANAWIQEFNRLGDFLNVKIDHS